MTGGGGVLFDPDGGPGRGRSAEREDVPSAGVLPPDTVGVATLARRIQASLREAFPRRFWLVGEASELERARARRSKHWFFRLVEEDPSDGRTYALGAVLWASDVRRLFGRGGVLEGVIEPKDGIQIRALCDIDFYPPNGDLRLVVRDIDPAFTLGKLALERRRLIERLDREGVLKRQRRLAVPDVPLRVGLITAENSAAYRDFVEEVRQAGLAIRVLHLDARMQGEETVQTVRAGLRTLAQRGVDVVCLVRGGGSAVDLAWFDAEEIAREIAACDVPVWTGIGHEIDTSVADLAAHTAFKTPTAVAAALAERGRAAVRELGDAVRRLARARDAVAAAQERLEGAAVRLGRTTRALDVERDGLFQVRARAVRAGRALVARAAGRLGADGRLLRSRAAHALSVPAGAVAALAGRLKGVPVRAAVRRERGETRRLARTAFAATARRLERGRERLDGCEARARLLDPVNVLRRGFAVLRDARGRVLKDAAAVTAGRRVQVELRDGRVRARVEGTEPDGPSPRPPRRPKEECDGEAEDGGEGRGSRQLEIW